MNFDLDEKDAALRERVKGLFDPASRDALETRPGPDAGAGKKRFLAWSKKLGDLGYLAPVLDRGGHSVGLAAVQESLASLSPSLFLTVEISVRLVGRFIARYGSPAQQARLLTPLEQGACLGTAALYRPEVACLQPNDGPGLSGTGPHVVNAPVADWCLVPVDMDGKNGFYLLHHEQNGWSAGPGTALPGFPGILSGSVTIENSPMDPEFLLGPNAGDAPFKDLGLWEDRILTAAGLGLMQRAFETARDFAKTHHSRGKPIIAYQEIGFKLAEMLTLCQTSRLLAFRAAWMSESGDREADLLARCAKVFCTESAEQTASHALQILGRSGLSPDNPAAQAYNGAKYLQAAGLSSERARMRIGDGLLDWE